ncbi:MAG TPA: hypothetical protein VHO06_09670 [Polyangia bacterium]|nr:hypothetical protein [Polyangia bacterium]
MATVGIGPSWGRRPRLPFPARRSAPGRAESLVVAGAVAAAETLAAPLYRRLAPNVRRIFATMDPTLGFAAGWAHGVGAELWVYAIDLHMVSYWRAGDFLRTRLLAWRDRAFRQATRVFALSDGMADWLRSIGVERPLEILPPLFPVGEPAPLPEGPLTFVMCGTVYSVNADPLRWLERAVKDLAPDARLRLLTPTPTHVLQAAGLDVSRWSVEAVPTSAVAAEVGRATWGVIGVDSGRSEDAERVAWPTKLREYLSVGRPVLCISRPEYAVARMVAANPWGIFASGEAETRAAVTRIANESRATLQARAEAAHRFAREQIDDRKIGAAIRKELCAP